MFKWFFKQVREISKDPRGFIKFGQITFILLSWSVFMVILIYFIFVPEEVNAINISLTVVVGFLGTILGLFFSEKALERLNERLYGKDEQLKENKNNYINFLKELDRIEKNVDNIKSKK